MLIDMAEDQPFYWGVDIPGMSCDQSSLVAAAVEGQALDLRVVQVNPAEFLTLHLDQDTVESVLAGLAGSQPDPVLDGFKEILADWLIWLSGSHVEPER
ncbi:hypothetical protein [Lentzea sp. NEAU-D7]|uniref:hypothetical protein n=1 Tax=Lentzea sp. NEAU-D7 TaxID=2994667 RepID=UPI00224B5F27|nr:hypothetical protein [Lentzea sp. NEAU-D7]MCX2950089.1 hypothetical protein [Lentzea sp. NEAU-D7]